MTTVIDTLGLTKQFKSGRGVKDIDLQVKRGQVFGFLGPNGAGKSTFVKMLVGLLQPTSGEARVLGLPLGDPARRKQIGYLPELFRYQDWLSGEEVLRFHARLCKMERRVAARRIEQVLRDVGLHGRAHERVRRYSKGMQQRLGLACALLDEPELLFLDEPASALDPGGRHDVRDLIARLSEDGMTIFLNTHLLEDVESICTEVALLVDGTIRTHGSVADILHPQPIWEFSLGGFDPHLLSPMNEAAMLIDTTVHVTEHDDRGFADLEVNLSSLEQAAWLNEQFIQLGMSVYRIHPRVNRLESWFLTLTESDRRRHV